MATKTQPYTGYFGQDDPSGDADRNFSQYIKYDGYRFPYTILSVDASSVYGQDNTQVIARKYTFTVEGLLYQYQTFGAGNIDSFKTRLHRMKNLFAQDGRTFEVVVRRPRVDNDGNWSNGGSDKLWNISPGNDMDNGPKIVSFSFNEFIGGRGCQYRVVISAIVKECRDGSTAIKYGTGPIEDMAYSVTWNTNIDGYLTRTVTGMLRVKDSAKPATKQYSKVWNIVNTETQNQKFVNGIYWERGAEEYSLSEDKRTLSFTLTINQVFNPKPWPLTTSNLTLSHTWTKNFSKYIRTLSGSVSAPPVDGAGAIVSKDQVFNAVLNIIGQKFNNARMYETFEVKDSLHSNTIGINVKAQMDVKKILKTLDKGKTGSAQDAIGVLDLDESLPTTEGKRPIQRPWYPIVSSPTSTISLCINSKIKQGPTIVIDTVSPSGGGNLGDPKNDPESPGDQEFSTQVPDYWQSYTEQYRYKYKSNKQVFLPKIRNGIAVVQQVGEPEYYLIRGGYGVRVADNPQDILPENIPLSTQYVVIDEEITSYSPEPAPNNKWMYRLSWQITYQIYGSFDMDTNMETPVAHAPYEDDEGTWITRQPSKSGIVKRTISSG